jgi:hypothetical protein
MKGRVEKETKTAQRVKGAIFAQSYLRKSKSFIISSNQMISRETIHFISARPKVSRVAKSNGTIYFFNRPFH